MIRLKHRRFVPKRRNTKRHLFLFVWALIILPVSSNNVAKCPKDCNCRLIIQPEIGGVLRVICTNGNMKAVPVDKIDRDAYIIIISAPPEHPNFLTIGPIFTQPVPYVHLRELQIINSNVPSIGQYSFWGLKNLKILNLSKNNLTGIETDNFRGLINLTELHLDHNAIEQMPSETFKHLTSLKSLTLSHNRITALVPRLFRMLAKLINLDLSYNPLTDLNPEVFKDIQHLKVFKCRKCFLQRINTQIYHLTPNIEELDLGGNLFKYLTSDEFISLKKLKKLKLDGNQLSVIVDNMFSRNHELRSLSLASNRLALLAPAALTNLTNIVHLDISKNRIDKFYLQNFVTLISLRNINFGGNNLDLDEIGTVLHILPDVNTVGLANLSLSDIPPNFFTYNQRLISLDLSWNKLTIFPYKLLTRTRFLQKLDISHNKLQTLDDGDLQRLEAISEIYLSGNQWNCDQCSVRVMLAYMSTTVLNSTIRQLKCFTPLNLRGMDFGEITYDDLEICQSGFEAQASILAGLALLFVALLSAIIAGFYCTKRRAAHYYTNEEKRHEYRQDRPEEFLNRMELGSVSTIDAPYHLMATES